MLVLEQHPLLKDKDLNYKLVMQLSNLLGLHLDLCHCMHASLFPFVAIYLKPNAGSSAVIMFLCCGTIGANICLL